MTNEAWEWPSSWGLRVREWASTLLNLIFPPTCANCHTVGTLLCEACIDAMPWVPLPICPRCGRPLDRPAEQCYLCARRPLPLQQVRTAVYFIEPVQSLVHQLKYKHRFALAQPLADLMLRFRPRWQTPVDAIVPIPLHARRYRQRGYNQAELLARRLSQQLQIPLNTSTLQRIQHTRSQVGLSRAARHANVADAFAVTDQQLWGQHILLVDDVFTTGATLSAATDALLAAGVTAVSGYCLARARQS